jgi:hypothetical protein
MKRIQNFSVFQNYSLIKESMQEGAEAKALQELKKLFYSDYDDEDIESLFLNLKDYGFKVSIQQDKFPQGEIYTFDTDDFIDMLERDLDKEKIYPTWNVKLQSQFDNPLVDIDVVMNEFKKIKKRCKEFTLINLKSKLDNYTNTYNFDSDIIISLDNNVQREDVIKILNNYLEMTKKESYENTLNLVTSFFGGEKAISDLEKILPESKFIERPYNFKRQTKRNIFDLDNNRIIFTYSIPSDSSIGKLNAEVRYSFNTIQNGKKTKMRRLGNFYNYSPIEVIIHLKSKNTQNFKFESDETLAYELKFDDISLVPTSDFQNYDEIQKIIDNLK